MARNSRSGRTLMIGRIFDSPAQLLIIVLILVSLLWGRIRHIYEDQEAAA